MTRAYVFFPYSIFDGDRIEELRVSALVYVEGKLQVLRAIVWEPLIVLPDDDIAAIEKEAIKRSVKP